MATREHRKAYFTEVQRFRQPLLWLFLLAIAAFFLYAVISQVVFGIPFGTRPASDGLLVVIWLVFGIGFPFFFARLALTVEVRSDGLYYRFFPLHLSFRRIAWGEVEGFDGAELPADS